MNRLRFIRPSPSGRVADPTSAWRGSFQGSRQKLRPTKRRVAHENGQIEGPHAYVKSALQQVLVLRGVEISTISADRRFIASSTSRVLWSPTRACRHLRALARTTADDSHLQVASR
jgi:hypothetical protein